MQLGELSVPFAAAAVHMLIRRGKLREGDRVSELVRTPPRGQGEKPAPSASGSEATGMTLGRLLSDLDPSTSPFTDVERKALAAMIGVSSSSVGLPAMTDYRIRGGVLMRILATRGAKPPFEVITSEVIRPLKLAHLGAGKAATEGQEANIQLMAPAAEVGQFFLKYRFDGRLLEGRTKPRDGALIGRGKDSLGFVLRRGDLLIIVLSRIPDDVPAELGQDLRDWLDRAIDFLRSPQVSPPTLPINPRSSAPRPNVPR